MTSTMLRNGVWMLVLAMALPLQLWAQNSAVTKKVRPQKVDHKMHWIGMHSGMTSGLGISYRIFPSSVGVQFTTMPLYYDGELRMSAGVTAMYAFRSTESYRILFYGSNSYNNFFWPHDEFRVNTGIGLGFEVFPSEPINLSLLLGYGGYNILSEDLAILPSMGIGLYYRLYP